MGSAVFVALLLLLTIVPFVELALLIRVYQATNLLTTLALVIGTGILGAALARRQGFQIWRNIQTQLANGKTPAAELLDGLMILIAGALLITPGILTDLAGFSLLLPPVRGMLRGWITRRLIPPGTVQFYNFDTSSVPFGQRHNPHEIEAEYTVETGDPAEENPRLPRSTNGLCHPGHDSEKAQP